MLSTAKTVSPSPSWRVSQESSVYGCNDQLPGNPQNIKWPRVHLVGLDAVDYGSCNNIGSGISPLKDGVRILGISLTTNEEGILKGMCDEKPTGAQDTLRFGLKHVDLVFNRSEYHDEPARHLLDENIDRLILEVKPYARSSSAHWKALVQARIYLAKHGGPFRMAMGEMLSFDTKDLAPLELRVEQGVFAIKMELCYVYQSFLEMPTFLDGDVPIFVTNFDPTALAYVHRALLALYSPKLVISDDGSERREPIILRELDVTIEQFQELLYQIYGTGRPLTSNVEALAKAATKLGCTLVLWALCRALAVNDNSTAAGASADLSFQQKVQRAVDHGLDDLVRRLCYDAVKSGLWEKLQGEGGFDARAVFGHEVYCRLVLPTIVEALNDKNTCEEGDPRMRTCLYEQKHPFPLPSFDSPYEASNPYNVRVQLGDSKQVFVNVGVLKASGCFDKFVHCAESGAYRPLVSANLKADMDADHLQLEHVFLPLLGLMYGTEERVRNDLIRPCLTFAYDHGMERIVRHLEDMLFNEVVDGVRVLISHLHLADKFDLKNLERHTLWLLESEEYHKLGLSLTALPDYRKLSARMRLEVEDRLCSGWAVYNKNLAKREPSGIKHYVLKMSGWNKAICEQECGDTRSDDLRTVGMVEDMGQFSEDTGTLDLDNIEGEDEEVKTAIEYEAEA